MTGQPEDQLIEEQDDRVVSERFGMLSHDAQALIEIDVTAVLAVGHIRHGAVEGADQVPDQTSLIVRASLVIEHCIEAGCIPTSR
ncbi:hypothetical protein D9M70_612350 [compost metagenome]